MNWQKKIKRIRKRNNWTQMDLAQLLETTQATVSRWERGKHLPTNAYKRLIAQVSHEW